MAQKWVLRQARFTERQIANLDYEADRLGVSSNEVLRRVIDEWIARRKARGAPILAERPPKLSG